jgi:hypothetical protein
MNGNAEQIERAVSVTLPKDRIPDEAEVTDLAGRFRAVFPVTDQEFASLIRRLHARIRIRMDVGTVIVEQDHAPWLSARKASIDPYYWSRFSTYLLSENWSPPGLPPIFRTLLIGAKMLSEVSDGTQEICSGVQA